MSGASHHNIDLIQTVARRLGRLRHRVVFLGGATTGLLITDPATPYLRSTNDVDLIVEVASRVDYTDVLRGELLRAGFVEDREEGAPLCRWVVDGIKVDVMPTSAEILGFTNRWYAAAIKDAALHRLPDGTDIHLITAPCFVGTKIEAFRGRGDDDYVASHDLEDVISLVDGRPALAAEIAAADPELRAWIEHELGALIDDEAFIDALPGHLPGDTASQARVPLIEQRLRQIAGRI